MLKKKTWPLMNYFMGKEFNRDHFPAFDVSVFENKRT